MLPSLITSRFQVQILLVNPDNIPAWDSPQELSRQVLVDRAAITAHAVPDIPLQLTIGKPDKGLIGQWKSAALPRTVNLQRPEYTYTLFNKESGKSHSVRVNADGSVTTSEECRHIGRLVLVPMRSFLKFAAEPAASEEEMEDVIPSSFMPPALVGNNSGFLPGAMLQLIDPNGAVVEEWTTEKRPKLVEGINPEVEYTLHELIPPAGFLPADDVVFTLNNDGSVSTDAEFNENGAIKVQHNKTRTLLNAADIATGETALDARLAVIDPTGHVIEQCQAQEAPLCIEGLVMNEQYTLRIVEAPEGFLLTNDASFHIDERGVPIADCTVSEEGVVLMELPLTHIEFDVLDIADGESLEGAHVKILDQDGEVVEEWDSTAEPHFIEGLKTEHQYTIHLEVAPDGYILTDDATFSIGSDGSINTELTQTDEQIFAIEIQKTRILIDAVDITDGEPVPGTFIYVYEGDEEDNCDEVTTDGQEPAVIEALKTGIEYYLSIGTPNGYIILEQGITLTIDAHGNVTTSATVTEDGVILAELTQGGSFCFNCKNTQGQQVPCSLTISGPVSLDIETQASSSFYKKLPFGTYTVEVLKVPNLYPQDSRNIRQYTAVLQYENYTSPDGLTFNDKNNRVEIIVPVTGASASEAL